MASPLAGRRLVHWLLLSGLCTVALLHYNRFLYSEQQVSPHITRALDRCRSLTVPPGPPADFHTRSASDRFEPGTRPTVTISCASVSSLGRVLIILVSPDSVERKNMDRREERDRSRRGRHPA